MKKKIVELSGITLPIKSVKKPTFVNMSSLKFCLGKKIIIFAAEK